MASGARTSLHWVGAAGLAGVSAVAVLIASLTSSSAATSSTEPSPAPPRATSTEVAPTTVAPTTTPTPALAPGVADSALAAVTAAGAAAGGTVSVLVVAADGTELLSSGDDEGQHYTASLVKLYVVGQLLADDEAGTITLAADDRDLMAAAITASDDTAMSTLWDRYDGAALVEAAATAYGLTGTGPPATAGQWGESTTTAADLATFLGSYAEHLDAADADTLLGWMQSTTAAGADGFDQQFGLVSATDDGTAAKQGWMCCVDGTRQLHSVGLLADGTAVVLLGEFDTATSWSQASTALDDAAAAVRTALS